MERNLDTMQVIQAEKEKDIDREGLPALDAEGKHMAEHKRYTIDIVDAPTDPLR